jgi:opacity protein-like surface antigen
MHPFHSNRRAVSTFALVLMILVVLAAFALLVAAAVLNRPGIPVPGAGGTVFGSGGVVTKDLQISDFKVIQIGSTFQASIRQASSYRVSVTMNENLFNYLETSKEGDTLAIGLRSGYQYQYQSLTLKAEIQLPDLNEVQLGGLTTCSIQGFSLSHKFTVVVSGASTADVANTSAASLETDVSGASKLTGTITVSGDARFTVSGASTITLGGAANNLSTVGSRASGVDLSNFKVHNAKVNLSGASHETINLDGRLDADVSGASKLIYIGNPTLGDISVTGSSTVTKQ